ncbi:MAG: flagellar hook assembly protein FlgD [Nitrospirae bacterium]|nr:flagellar hook assembly protein FlgD [Nitrospirota bacterium]MBI3352053.1 flagellar hook assembly protein FlgD [Nitrospirota bacterium]
MDTTGLNSLGSNAFLRLLTTQLKYQDPLKPMDNTQFVSQLAQFSQLEQLSSINKSVTSSSDAITSMNNKSLANLIGKNVLAEGGTVALANGNSSSMAYELKGDAAKVEINISDSAGKVVRTMQMGPQVAGIQTLSWDGLSDAGTSLPQGGYTYSVSAKNVQGLPVSATTYTQGQVNGVIYDQGSAYLIINGEKVPASGLLQIY